MSLDTVHHDATLADYLARVGWREPLALAALRAETAGHRLGHMQLAPQQGALLALLLRLIGATRYLEVGTFTGYSALTAALAMGESGRVTACDVSDTFTRIARRHWEDAGVAGRIELVIQPALLTLNALLADGAAGSFDCVLIDADKPSYPAYYERALQLVRQGGLIVLDNMLLGGRVLARQDNEPPGVAVVRALNASLLDDQRVEPFLLPLGDGMTLLRKR
ncbi:O-methyltransferase [Chitiniphilus shinanonensis]|uniref:O-methyltransferase n=1 Tax=Chitiniphilus shinanonensis TaxID=553088 RepID=A0ABQ6BTL0_9NEIS|nr:class I SAM-dependent methyltransferase [Chitiniphilus shinanonensis]GLS04782.1 O-methyltransferase [Chitiniphilus shinanonensis]